MQQISSDQLLKMPLFMGMSDTDLNEIKSRYGLTSQWYKGDKKIVEENTAVSHLILLYKGMAKKITMANDKGYSITEIIEAPSTLQIERLFGISTHFTSSYIAYGNCQTIEISKSSVYHLLNENEIFRLNFINNLSSQQQRTQSLPFRPSGRTLNDRLCQFVERISTTVTGTKDITITMNRLAQELFTTRLKISETLHRLEDKELIRIQRGHIIIPSIKLLKSNM